MAASKAFNISACAPQELRACFALMSAAFGRNAPVINVLFPNHFTPTGAEQGTKRLEQWQQSEPHAHFIKATSSLPNVHKPGVSGFAVWTLMPEQPPQELDDTEDAGAVWGRLENAEVETEFARQIWRRYVKPRSAAVRESNGKGVYVLELLTVHPEAQGQGLGEALVRWGTKAADEKGLEAVVESTPVARKLYEKCGFRATIEEMDFDVDKKFSDRRKPVLTFLRRQAEVNDPSR